MKRQILALILFAVAFMIAVHQFLYWGVWFEVGDIHHETFMISLVFAGLMVWFIKIEKDPVGSCGCFG